MNGLPVRLRLAFWYSAVLLVALAAFGAAISVVLERRLVSGVDKTLSGRVAGLKTTLEVEKDLTGGEQLRRELSEFALESAEGDLMQLQDDRGKALLPFPDQARPLPLQATGDGYHTAVLAGHEYRVLVSRFPFDGRSYQAAVASDLAPVREVMKQVRAVLFWLIPPVLALACAGGYWLGRRALAPVDEITRVAKSISVENLSRRLAVPRTNDEIQRLSETWNQVLERLDGAVKRIRQFTADASHELRTPVAVIRATAELGLRRERSGGEYREALEQIQAEAERLQELTESLLALARADEGSAAMPLSQVDGGEAVAAVIRQMEPVAGRSGVMLRATIPQQPLPVRANEAGLRRLLIILLDNAIRHTPGGGTVTVAVSGAEAGVRIAVEDTGEGIQPDVLPHVFERFYRADPARASGPGAGLGLSIAQEIARGHGAVITAASTPGSGARFEFVLSKGTAVTTP